MGFHVADLIDLRKKRTIVIWVWLIGCLVLLGVLTNVNIPRRHTSKEEAVGSEEAYANLYKFVAQLSQPRIAGQAEVAPGGAREATSRQPIVSSANGEALAVPHGNGGLVKRNGTQGPRQMCKYSEAELHAALKLPHGCGRGGQRYLHKGEWMPMQWLIGEMEIAVDGPEAWDCVLACLDTPAPCDHSPCLLPFHLRYNSSDVLVLQQLLEKGDYDPISARYNFTSILDAGANVGIASVLFAVT
eukprot:jgi/Mesen1/4245/ME000022S03533